MKMKRAYEILLRLYPADYRTCFAAEMLHTFDRRAVDCGTQGPFSLALFAFAELTGLLMGVASEWTARLTGDRSARDRPLPDIQDELVAMEHQIAIATGRMVQAIANHDFPNARLYSYRERELRDQLQRLKEMRGTDGCAPPQPLFD